MTDVDDFWWLPSFATPTTNNYTELGRIFQEDALRDEINDSEPIDRVVLLIKQADKYSLNDWEDDLVLYQLAAEAVLDPLIQLELGCVLLQRAGVDERPLCTHMYNSSVYADWDPQTVIHEKLEDGPPSRHSVELVNIALKAYANAWSYYKWAHGTGAHYLIHSLLALDGMRVCYEELDDAKHGWWVSQGLPSWLDGDYQKYKNLELERECDEIISEIKNRFQRTAGRYEPRMAGRKKVLERLHRHLAWLDTVPSSVRDYLADAEYMRANLKDPSYNPKGVVAAYCLVIEEMLQRRIGDPVDAYLVRLPENDVSEFKARFLQDRRKGKTVKEWKCGELTLGQFERNLRTELFKSFVCRVGGDADYCFRPLPGKLKKLLEYRHPASHARKGLFTEDSVANLHDMVVGSPTNEGILPALSRLRLTVVF